LSDEHITKLKEDIQAAIADPTRREALYTCMKRGRDQRANALLDWPGGAAFREDVRAAKDRCLDQQDELMQRFIANAEQRGAKVFVAKDGPAAIEYVLNVAKKRGAKTVSKSKSLTTEEIELNVPLEEAGLRVVETDLGELIIQLVDERPYHLVFPSIHKTAKEVAEIFTKATGKPVPNDIESIMGVVRPYLRPIFLESDIGLTGANVGVAETGAIAIETNEGNARLVSSIGDCHICVMGMEKIVETMEEAMLMVAAHPLSATGQCPTTYVTWMAGRSPMGEGEGQERESHIVILDNGRTAMREDERLKEALRCIRCGACMNICPTYGVVGGHTFGHIYPGPIGIPWTAAVHGLDAASTFSPLCISCGLCKEICPAEIDIPLIIAEVKHRHMKEHGAPKADRTMMAADRFAWLGSATAPVSNWFLKNPLFRRVLENVAGVDRRRTLPPFSRPTFTKQFARRTVAQPAAPNRKVALFIDVYANYNAPKLGMAVVDHLMRAGCDVSVPKQTSSGYPYIAYGDLEKAGAVARRNVASMVLAAREGRDIVSPEPTAAYALKKSYPSLLPDSEDARLVADHTYELFEYLLMVQNGHDAQPLKGRRFGFHCSCHQRPLGSGEAAMEWLRKQGAEVELIETGTCCGMGGTFGLKAGPLGYDLSQAVGQHLFEAFLEADIEAIVSESSVCAIQLAEGTGIPVIHPLELLQPPQQG